MYRALMITMTTLLMLVPLKRLFLAVRPLRAKLIEPKVTSCDHFVPNSSSDKKMGSKLQKIRALMQLNKINAYIVPSGDAHQSEYICAKDARRSFISEFTGSAGTAVILLDEAFLWTDGRYFLQASNELTSDWKLMKMATEGFPQINEYLLSKLKKDEKVGIDPLLFSFEDVEQMKKEGLEVKSLEENLVDLVWEGKPLFPKGKIEIQELEYSGQDFVEKIEGVRVQIQKNNTWGLVVSALDEIAWLFNLRGTDIDFNPVFLSYAVVTQDETVLYLDTTKLTPELIKHLSSVTLKEYTQVFADLESFSQNYASKCLVDKKCNLKLVEALGGNVLVKSNPIEIQKAIKNMTEIKGFYDCHQRDAVALCRYFNWLEQTLLKGTEITEAAAADRLELFRSEMPLFKGLSFDTISSTGPNGAIIHYHPTHDHCKVIDINEVYLCDSGGQYKDGTTDTTRTMHFGTPKPIEKDCYTRVLKGHIMIDKCVFPKGTTGYRIDTMARMFLWQVGLDFKHGTGHGVGSFLNVHEGPHGIGFRIVLNEKPLEAGMTITNEPGYYREGEFGIRIENVMVVKNVETKYQGGEFYGFESCTVVPISTKLIDMDIMTIDEIAWVNAYNTRCYEALKNDLKGSDLDWLKRECSLI